MVNQSHTHSHEVACHSPKRKFDYLLWGSIFTVAILYVVYWIFTDEVSEYKKIKMLAQSVFDLMNTIQWGIVIGMIMVAILTKVPREFAVSILGTGRELYEVLRGLNRDTKTLTL